MSFSFLLLFPLLIFFFCEFLLRFLLHVHRVLILPGLRVKAAESQGDPVEVVLFCVLPKYVLFRRLTEKWIEMQTETLGSLSTLASHNFPIISISAGGHGF